MMKGHQTMDNPISPDLLAKLRAAEGEGLSRDPKNNPHKTIRLLSDKDVASKWCPFGATAGQYLIGDVLYDDYIWTPIKFLDTFDEWGVDRSYVDTYYTLPDDAKYDLKARCYLRANRNSVEEAAEIMGLINGEVCRQRFRMGALYVARGLNSAASNLTAETGEPPLRLPFFAANWRMGSIQKFSSNGKSYWQPTFGLVAIVGRPGGPSWDDFDQCRRLCHLLASSMSSAKATGSEEKAAAPFWENAPTSDAPPSTGNDAGAHWTTWTTSRFEAENHAVVQTASSLQTQKQNRRT
jgi:hypothetical protein